MLLNRAVHDVMKTADCTETVAQPATDNCIALYRVALQLLNEHVARCGEHHLYMRTCLRCNALAFAADHWQSFHAGSG